MNHPLNTRSLLSGIALCGVGAITLTGCGADYDADKVLEIQNYYDYSEDERKFPEELTVTVGDALFENGRPEAFRDDGYESNIGWNFVSSQKFDKNGDPIDSEHPYRENAAFDAVTVRYVSLATEEFPDACALEATYHLGEYGEQYFDVEHWIQYGQDLNFTAESEAFLYHQDAMGMYGPYIHVTEPVEDLDPRFALEAVGGFTPENHSTWQAANDCADMANFNVRFLYLDADEEDGETPETSVAWKQLATANMTVNEAGEVILRYVDIY